MPASLEGVHKEILTKEQIELLPLFKLFTKDFGLVVGTAVALHLGHRRSIDFDMFSDKKIKNQTILNKIADVTKIDKLIVNKLGELTLIANGVKITFFHYPYDITYSEKMENVFKMPDLLTLAAMKAFALGMRSKWKDYVDLYFIIKHHLSVKEISDKSEQIFHEKFNEKLFRTQLAYFKDMDYREQVEFMPGFEVADDVVKKALVEFSVA